MVPVTSSTPQDQRRLRRDRSQRRVNIIAAALSVLLHLLILLIARSTIVGPGRMGRVLPDFVPEIGTQIIQYTIEPDATVAVNVTPVPDEPAPVEMPPEEPPVPEEPPQPESIPEEVEAAPVDEPPVETEPEPEPAPDNPTAGDLLRPWAVNPLLWIRGREMTAEEFEEERELRGRIYATIQALADSVMAADEAARRALDWTVRDSAGRRWGIAPEGVYFAGRLVPLPIRAATPAGRREEFRAWERTWQEIEIQAEREAARVTREERAEAIRERVDAERASTATGPGSSSGGEGGN